MMEYGLIGRKLGHSYSPLIHKGFGKYDYSLKELEPEEVPAFLRNEPFLGLNVTIPYKKTALEYCSTLSHAARTIGAVNTLKRLPDGFLHGDNTDYDGFAYLATSLGLSWNGAKVLILGTGGASLTVRAVARDNQAREILFVSRRGPITAEVAMRDHTDADILVNATPCGMYPDNTSSPLDLAPFTKLRGVLDLIYNPARTRLLLQARAMGIPCSNGLPMLVEQARCAAEIWLEAALPQQLTIDGIRNIRAATENIALIGMPGSGKTTLGKRLAKQMHREFVDTDQCIEREAGMSIPDIFATKGEEWFRNLEERIIAEHAARSGIVLATGGGAILRPANRLALQGNSRILWMQRPLEQLATGGRPLSSSLERLRQMYSQREPLYRALADEIRTSPFSG